jgi:ATP-dependent DNA helicase RecG
MARLASADPGRIPLTALAGVGPARAARLAALGLESVRDLLFLAPRRLEQSGLRRSAAEACAEREVEVAVCGELRGLRLFRRGWRRSVLSLELVDGSGSIRALFFNQPWLFERLRALAAAGKRVELSGRVGASGGEPALLAPRLLVDPPERSETRLLPVYPLTEGIGQDLLRRIAREAAGAWAGSLLEPLPRAALERLGLPPLPEAVRELHAPGSREAFPRARRRLALERLLGLQARLAQAALEGAGAARALVLPPPARAELLARLPFPPTAGQRLVLSEILDDLARERPMRRLLQGEVGAGKTLVALAACAAIARAGGQAALLAPTEILCEQHHQGLVPALQHFALRAVLLSASQGAPARRAALAELASGSAALAVGTHALLSPQVRFARLELVVIDEQQRFGVAQKRALLEKGRDVHALLMTATPIPRTLALCFYGDLATSFLAELPPGRGPVETKVVPAGRRAELLGFLAQRAAAGERVFWVCPRIAADPEAEREPREECASAERTHAWLAGSSLARFGLELVHGRIRADQRARAVERFRSGESRLLVGTSIVEVGVDVPQATVMVIEGAERFGLAQLHQLRGRVGRSPRPSWCFLLAGGGEVQRLAFLERSADGFAIAEEDLRRRGMGDLAGSRQAGENAEGLSEAELDLELVQFARTAVRDDAELRRHYLGARGLRADLV